MPIAKERYERWNPDTIYVIGHQRPDTDAIASALGYAWYLNETSGENFSAARAGQHGEQAQYALRRFEMNAPQLLTGVAPTFGHAARTQPYVKPEDPLPAAMLRVAEGDRVIPVVDAEGIPVGVVTSLALARAYTAPVNVAMMLAQQCQSIAETPLTFRDRDRISDHRNALLRSETDDFLVVSEEGRYVGIATRRRILEPPRARLILVDHNELTQAVPEAEQAEIVGVLDHHRLGNAPTAAPIPFVIDPVGSTSTLVAEKCRAANLTLPRGLAGMLLSGILSDTLVFRSPTATERDEAVAYWLSEFAQMDVRTYGEELIRSAPGLSMRSAEEMLDTDRKAYTMGGVPVSIGQIEVTSFADLPDRREELLETMRAHLQKEGLAFLGLMVTDVVTGISRLLCVGEHWIVTALPFTRLNEGEYDLEEMLSRKKQLVPTLSAILDELR
jgi:manganese-dependent inorganic pyrophosphatase